MAPILSGVPSMRSEVYGWQVVSQASPLTREEGPGQLCIMSLCRVSSGQALQRVTSKFDASMLHA